MYLREPPVHHAANPNPLVPESFIALSPQMIGGVRTVEQAPSEMNRCERPGSHQPSSSDQLRQRT
jgi:hypothetical protein